MLSIITPVLNSKNYIESCIKCVIDQDCPNIEHIIIDGGSTDGTLEIIKRSADTYAHVRWLSEIDNGQSDAMNKGIEMSRGEFIGILNADDYYSPGALSDVMKILNTLPAPGLLVGNCNVWDSEGNLLFVNKPKNLLLRNLLLSPEIFPHPINPSAYFYHKSLHEEIGYYKVDEQFAMDLDFLLRAVQVASVRYVDRIWGNFRIIEGSKTFVDSNRVEGIQRFERILKSYRHCLRLHERILVQFGRSVLKLSFFSSVMYFAKQPNELGWRAKARLRKIINMHS